MILVVYILAYLFVGVVCSIFYIKTEDGHYDNEVAFGLVLAWPIVILLFILLLFRYGLVLFWNFITGVQS
jgi:hypothetical protein